MADSTLHLQPLSFETAESLERTHVIENNLRSKSKKFHQMERTEGEIDINSSNRLMVKFQRSFN
ncbi:hypothetical protein RvY_02857 [Ramazzottius varieornatus]|uniref:Uncharacterized protein n=1 Tax=Ramazzottius varieornatus TaxID=947166 RepID=A0A1D1UVP5_RAMVA|nr:hypothetical protein RvY_02857 [Ramazzottius varieornatus]